MQIQTTLNLNGIVNALPSSLQQPDITFDNLPFSLWTTLSAPRTVTGKVIGIAQPQQYQVALFAVQSKTTLASSPAWLGTVAADGTFSLSLPQAATAYAAVLMTPAFAQSYFAAHFQQGTGSVASLPLPSEYPGQVLVMARIPAGLNRELISLANIGMDPVRPGQAWNQGFSVLASLNTSSSPPALDPTNPQYFSTVWNSLVQLRTPFSCTYGITAQTPRGEPTNGAFATGLYVYGQSLFLVAGYGPSPRASNPSSVQPNIVATPIVTWGALAPSAVQVGLSMTILSEQVVLAVDLVNVQSSMVAQFLEALVKLEVKLIGALFDML